MLAVPRATKLPLPHFLLLSRLSLPSGVPFPPRIHRDFGKTGQLCLYLAHSLAMAFYDRELFFHISFYFRNGIIQFGLDTLLIYL